VVRHSLGDTFYLRLDLQQRSGTDRELPDKGPVVREDKQYTRGGARSQKLSA
jgi:hypothetical protein